MDGVDDKTGKMVVPARWPHVGMLARLYLGVDTTTTTTIFHAESNFSALWAVVSKQGTTVGPQKTEHNREDDAA